MFKRKIYDKLVEWKTKYNDESAMLIEDARDLHFSFLAKFCN